MEWRVKNELYNNTDEEALASWEKPNGFVIRGDRGTPVIVSFDEVGRVLNRGGVMEGPTVAEMFPDGIKADQIVLVHVVEGDGTMLIKKLEGNRLVNKGKPISAKELMEMKLLNKMATQLRLRYVHKHAALKRGESVEDLEPCRVGFDESETPF